MYKVIDKIFSEVKREMARAKVIAFGIPVNEWGHLFSHLL